MKKRILVIASTPTSLINFRGDFIKNLIANGYDVFTAAESYTETTRTQIEEYGAVPLQYYLQRTGTNPLKDLKSISQLKAIIINNNINLVFPYTIKPVIYGSIAANSCNVPVVSLITGLGFTFSGLNIQSRLLQKLNEFLYKRFVRKNKAIVFQNIDDKNLFFDRKILTEENQTFIVSGSGVNLEKFKFRIKETNNEKISFLFIARLIKEKGIQLYIEAAKSIKKTYPKAEFHVIGPAQNSPSAIKLEELNRLHKEGILIYHGLQSNIVEHLTDNDVFVLPSYYREGVPRSILEALSVGLPTITTDSPGCRETVIPGENGFLIPPKSLKALEDAMEFFIKDRKKLKEMGINSRRYAERRFDVKIINQNLLKIIDDVLGE